MPANLINQFPSIQQMTDRIGKSDKPQNTATSATLQGKSFEQILNERASSSESLKFSKHASLRMQTRSIDLSQAQRERLENGVEMAGQKGIKESLVMVDDLAFIVNVSNNTVITAVGEGDDRVFTNIDGAVIA